MNISSRFARNQELLIEFFETEMKGGALRAPIVLLPGLLSSASYWLEKESLVHALTQGGTRRVLGMSFRGRGKSTLPRYGFSLEAHLTDIQAVLDHANLGPVVLVGHSAGAAYALGFALRFPQKVLALIMGDYPPLLPPLDENWLQSQEEDAAFDGAELLPRRLFEESAFQDLRGELRALRCPLLVLCGEEDQGAMLPEKLLRVFDGVPQLESALIPAGHDVFSSPAVESACLQFIEKL